MFVYVMDKCAMEQLLKNGYQLVKSDEQNSLWIFENKADVSVFSKFEFKYAISDVISF